MLKPDSESPAKMTDVQRAEFQRAVAEELAAKDDNIAAAKEFAPSLRQEAAFRAAVVQRLREARVTAGVSLAEMTQRTGIQKSALSRLENSKAPNPTLATLRKYAAAIGKQIDFAVVDDRE